MSSKRLALLREPLVRLGFRRRADGIYTVELAEDILGWVGLNTASDHEPPGTVEVNPVVGVRHQGVERVVAECRGLTPHAYIPPTLSTSIGYVMPQRRYTSWRLDESNGPAQALAMATAIERYGLPFMSAHVTPESLVTGIESLGFYSEFTLPVLLALTGRRDAALERLNTHVQSMGDRQDAAAVDFRKFADVLRRR